MNIKILKMNLSDIDFVYQEELNIFGKSLGLKALHNEVSNNNLAHYFIAWNGSKRVGYIGSWLTVPNAEILNLFVVDEYRSNGIGKMLLNKVINLCKISNIDKLTLEVRKSNNIAIKFYESFNFYVGTIRKNYYENKEDAFLMVLDVGGIK